MKRVLGVTVMVLALVMSVLAQKQESQDTKAAQAAAESWLALVDKGDYAASWTEAASLLKESVGKGEWESTAATVRGKVGKVLSRHLISAKPTASLPGSPDGKYVVVQFETNFEKLTPAVETVTPMLDKEGKWRVAGYFIR